MTAETLRAQTRKQLETLARRDRLPGWHGMTKEQLVKALLKCYRSREPGASRGKPEESAVSNPTPRSEKPSGSSSKGATLASMSREGASRKGSGPTASTLIVDAVPGVLDRLEVTAMDSHWLRVEWALSVATMERARVALGAGWRTAVAALHLLEIVADDDGTPVRSRAAEIAVRLDELHWFVHLPHGAGKWLVELGFRTTNGRFHPFLHAASSNRRSGTRTGTAESECDPVRKLVPRSVAAARRLSENRLSLASTDNSSPCWTPRLKAELRLHGQTAPGADVMIQHEPIPVNADGEFQVRIPLENGRIVVPAELLSPDASEQRTVIVAVELNLREMERQVFDEMLE